jgi:imidazolonepropionase-like amidohydrolase
MIMAAILVARIAPRRAPSLRGFHLALCVLLANLLALWSVCGWSQPLVIRHVTVIDATGRAAQPDMGVLIDAGHIIALGPWKQLHAPRGALSLDGTGKFLIPGLWDMHVHGASDSRAPWSHLLFLANGVVGVRDMAGPPDARAWRATQTSAPDPSPTIYLGSPIVDGQNPVWPDSIVVANEAQGREVVDQQQQRGADFIKVYSKLSRDAYFAIADEANQRGIPFEGHVPDSVTAAEASAAGQRSIEHLTQVAAGSSSEEAASSAELQRLEALFWAPGASMAQKMEAGRSIIQVNTRIVETFDAATAQSLFALFIKNGTWQTPTLCMLQGQIDDPLDTNDPRLKYLSKEVRSKWDDGYYKHYPPGPRAALIELSKAQFDESMKIVGLMYNAGVPILAGTDTMNPHCFPGFGIHDELALLVDAGMSPLAALQAATRNAAQFMGQLDRRGTIEVGKVADLVLLDKDPLADIHNTRTIHAVVLNGRLFGRSALDQMLAKAQALANGEPVGPAGK